MLNIIRMEDGIMCFRDIIYIIEIILNFLNILCCFDGRFVIYYNNRINYLFFDGYSFIVFNYFCEIEVYGNLMNL